MRFILSPARNINDTVVGIACTKPLIADESKVILEKLKDLAPWELESVLDANGRIAQKAFTNIQDFDLGKPGAPAMFTYNGLVYKYLAPASLSKEAVEYSRSSMRIISAFYGLLRPLDGIRPYRLEMRSKLKIDNKSLYDFWGSKIYDALYEGESRVINLASEEYAKIVRKYLKPTDSFIDVIFYGVHKGQRRIITTMAKTARGQMARYILEHGVDRPEALKAAELDGWTYVESLSSPNRYVFISSL